MSRVLISFGIGMCLLLSTGMTSYAKIEISGVTWKRVNRGIRDLDIRTVSVSTYNADVVYVGSSRVVYKSTDGGESWNEVLTLRGTENEVECLAINSWNGEIIYAGTREGLYESRDGGKNWIRIFKSIGESESVVFSVAPFPMSSGLILIGTGSGTLRTENGGKSWTRSKKLPLETVVYSVAVDNSDPEIVFAATDRGIYKSYNSGMEWKKVFGNGVNGNDYNDDNDGTADRDETTENGSAGITIRSIAFDPTASAKVFAGTSDGLFMTKDGGLTWRKATSRGLIGNDLRHIVMSQEDPDGIFAATGRGVFRYSKHSQVWKEMYKGLTSRDIHFLAFDTLKASTIWAATEGGVFKTILSPSYDLTKIDNKNVEPAEMLSHFNYEPTIEEIQVAAIRYAEVHPEKIERWRKAAAKKAWLPDLSVSYGEDWQSSTYFYSTSSEKYTDDDVTAGDDWSVSLTWKSGDLIWNDDQTSIDTRSRLMVQLRDDVVNEVTRLYFERRRLQLEMLLKPPDDVMERIENELRLQELTADIDALTGFYLSRRLRQGRKGNK